MKTDKGNKPKEYLKPLVILCEGESDHVFLRLVLKEMGEEDRFDVEFPARDGESTGGKSKFAPWLSRLKNTSSTFRENVKAILILSDCDESADKSFAEITATLSNQNAISVPKAIEQFGTQPGLKVFLSFVPKGAQGCLETLCVVAAFQKFGLEQQVKSLISQTPANDWPENKRSKAMIHTIIACTCLPKPEASLSQHWKEKEEYHIPVNHEVFSDIRCTISKFIAASEALHEL